MDENNYSDRGKLKVPLSESSLEFENCIRNAPNGYLVIPNSLYLTLTWDEVAMIFYLYNIRRLLELQGDLEKGGWFPCAVKRMQKERKIKRDAQYRILNMLVSKRILRTKIQVGFTVWRGKTLPRKHRMFRLNLKRIKMLIWAG